jgi:hypothetical protein
MVLPVGRHSFANRRRRTALPVVAVFVPAAVFFAAAAAPHPAAFRAEAVCCAEIVTATPTGEVLAAAAARYLTTPAPGQTLVASTRASARDIKLALPVGVASERGMQVETILAARAVSAMFREIRNIGGVRPDALKWHPNGLAIDVMIPNYRTAEGKALGDRIAAFALLNTDRFGLNHVIWRQIFYPRSGAPKRMANLGSDDANHYTHVHIATNGGGYPTGGETYFY